MFSFCSIFLAFVYTLMLKILGSKYGVVEEIDSNFSVNRSQKDDRVVPNNSMVLDLRKNEEDLNGNISDTEDSVFLQSGLIGKSSKCRFISGKDVCGYLEEPKNMKFLVEEMFVGSNEDLVSSDHHLFDEIPQRKDSEINLLEFDEEPNSLSFSFNLFNPSCSTNEVTQSQGHISEMENIDQERAKILDFYEDKEILSSNDSKDFEIGGIDYVRDEILEDHDFSYEIELFPFGQISTVDANQESDVGTPKADQRKPEYIEEEHDIDHKQLISVEDLDDEYIELEPHSVNLTHITKESTSCEDAKKFRDFDSDDDDDEDDEPDVLWEHQNLVQQMKMELKNCSRIGGLPTISEECETPKILEDLKPLKIDRKIEYKDIMEEIHKFYKSYIEKMRKLDILNYQTLHAISFLQLKDSEVFTAGKKMTDSVTFLLPKFWPRKVQRIYADPIHKSIVEMHRDLELVYVGQLCLSWEILSWLYVKARELLEYDSQGNRSYNRAAEEFQQFQVLMQRFMEDELFQGQRNQNYAKKEQREETDAISLELLTEIIKESILIFREFIFWDKKAANVVLKEKAKGNIECRWLVGIGLPFANISTI
ncbi:hypothetical protein DH2020_032577 [Rehmannia glutinosa]|uniref:Uncharacterized protein n=1 Tax=Rehmannia glutinosa TaxID=99300 RepID=A0ABR0VEQ3_REHGL